MTDTMWIALVIAAIVVGCVAGHGIGRNNGFIDGLETGVNLVAWVKDGMPKQYDGDGD